MYVFGEFVLDLQLYQLRRLDQVVPLEPKVFDVLRYLVEHSDRVATKRELLDALWPHEVVTEAVLPTNINALRRALGQPRGEKWPIETVHGRGYRFSMPVERSLRPPPSETELVRPPSASPPPLTPERCVGRAPLQERLRKLLLRALAEHGQVCVLSGDAGSGKSCTARTLAALARTHGADVWTVHGQEPRASLDGAAAAPPLWACAELLRAALASEGVEALRRWLGPLAQELAEVLAALGDPREQRLHEALRGLGTIRMFDALVRVLTQASRTRARMLWIEDAQHLDEASWQVLRTLVPHLERASVLLLLTLRTHDDQLREPARGELDVLLHGASCQRFALRGLELEEVAELAAASLGQAPSPELARALRERSGGNPLFLSELLGWLDARGCIDASGSSAREQRCDADALRDAADLPPAELARQLVRRRVLRLGNDVKQLLDAAAVVGTRWDAAVVERVSALPHRTFAAALELAVSARLVVQERAETHRTAHELLRETLYADLAQRERRRLHLRVAAALEPRIAWLGIEGVRDVATHLFLALPDGEPQRAVEWLERAAELSEQAGDHREAARYYRAALTAARRSLPADSAQSGAPTPLRERAAGERGVRVPS